MLAFGLKLFAYIEIDRYATRKRKPLSIFMRTKFENETRLRTRINSVTRSKGN